MADDFYKAMVSGMEGAGTTTPVMEPSVAEEPEQESTALVPARKTRKSGGYEVYEDNYTIASPDPGNRIRPQMQILLDEKARLGDQEFFRSKGGILGHRLIQESRHPDNQPAIEYRKKSNMKKQVEIAKAVDAGDLDALVELGPSTPVFAAALQDFMAGGRFAREDAKLTVDLKKQELQKNSLPQDGRNPLPAKNILEFTQGLIPLAQSAVRMKQSLRDVSDQELSFIGKRATKLKSKLGWKRDPASEEYQQALTEMSNMILKNRSGAAVTPSEMERVMDELAGSMGNPTNVRNILNAYADRVSEQYARTYRAMGFSYQMPPDLHPRVINPRAEMPALRPLEDSVRQAQLPTAMGDQIRSMISNGDLEVGETYNIGGKQVTITQDMVDGY